MFAMPLEYWLGSAPGLLFILLGIVVIVRAVWTPSDVRRGASCGGCGHAVTDVSTGRCNECGGLLTRVGIVAPAAAIRLRSSLGLATLAWTGMCLACGYLGTVWIEQMRQISAYSSQQSMSSSSTSFNYEPSKFAAERGRPSVDVSPLDFRIVVTVDKEMDGTKVVGGEMTMTLRRNGTGTWAIAKFPLTKKTFTVLDQDEKEIAKGETFELEHAEKLYKAAGLNVTDDLVRVSLPDVVKLANRGRADPESLDSSGSISMTEPPLGALASRGGGGTRMSSGGSLGRFVPFWQRPSVHTGAIVTGVIYVAGLILIAWRRARMVRIITQ